MYLKDKLHEQVNKSTLERRIETGYKNGLRCLLWNENNYGLRVHWLISE